ncbi:MAG: ABC transporter substrate-binding protein, partial [Pseudomonadota bacterium]|nr:ABC transporter substrate-binding protein [Pseudomonadota bacterium]
MKAWEFQKPWMMLAMLAMAVCSSFTQATLAEPTAHDPRVFEDPQPLLAERIDELIRRLSDNADQIHKDQSIAYQISDELMAPHIDFRRISRLIIGKYWKTASPAQQQRLIEEIKALLVRSYVTAMVSYVDDIVAVADQKGVKYLPSRYKAGDKKASVRATIALEGGQTADVQYQLYYRGEWRIYDIRIEGISLAITYRSSFGEQIKRDGLDSLIAQLADRNRKG